jgi:hypothetical protein
MTILTSFTSGCHKAQIRSSLAAGFRKLYTGTSTESDGRAARNLVAKYFGTLASVTVREVTAKSEITALIGNFMNDPQRKQVFRIWTFEP